MSFVYERRKPKLTIPLTYQEGGDILDTIRDRKKHEITFSAPDGRIFKMKVRGIFVYGQSSTDGVYTTYNIVGDTRDVEFFSGITEYPDSSGYDITIRHFNTATGIAEEVTIESAYIGSGPSPT
jgi:hypothetical protein